MDDERPPAPDDTAAADTAHATELVRAGLEPLRFLVGEWVGTGISHGEPVRGRMRATLEVDQTFLMTRETGIAADGTVDFEDLAIYRWEGAEQTLKVRHMQAPGTAQEYHVEPVTVPDAPDGVQWNAGPFSPRVLLRPDGHGGLHTEVWMAWRSKPDTVMSWTRAEDPA